ncbi:MAG: hypothetical protein FJ303_12195 [Planctomycetes bacterium]|nr:hypothetical protein [Planctomycetota bacterium]
MRRGFAWVLGVAAILGATSTASAQYPYPYAPMPYGPMPMPARPMHYSPAPMMMPPAPMWQAPTTRNTNVFIYGPLDGTPTPPPNPLMYGQPQPRPTKSAEPKKDAQAKEPASGVVQPQGTFVSRMLPTYSKAELPPSHACAGADCGPACGPTGCGPAPYEPPMRGKGHFIGEVGAFFLVPLTNSRSAYNVTAGGATTTTDFQRQLDWGPVASLGYVFHTGWGVRGSYQYLRGSTSLSTANADPAVGITTPFAAFPVASPGATLLAGLGVDQYNFTQRLERHIADIEAIREGHFLDTTLLFSVGARFARLAQSYNAIRRNAGGTNGAVSVALDREELDSYNRFEGWGPTVSFEIIHPLRCGFSLYGNVRGSFLWGTDKFTQTYHNENRTTNAGVPNFIDTTTVAETYDVRYASIFETEFGIQYGHRLGRCYFYARAGGVYQHWFDVGNPTNSTGNMSFVGGTLRMGISY